MSASWFDRYEAARPAIARLVEGHQPEAAGPRVQKFEPRSGTELYSFAAADGADVDRAVQRAREAFDDGRWSRMPLDQRKARLARLADLMEASVEELALLECSDVGKPIGDALTGDLPAAVAKIRYAIEACDKLGARVFHRDATSHSYQVVRPIGVIGAIVGWNFPLSLAAGKVGPALATGNTLVLKPSELTSLSAVVLARLALEAGIPEHVLTVLCGDGATGDALARHNDVDLISFTGSSRTGRRLLSASGESNMKRLVLECGGKAPNIVFPEAPPLEAVARDIVQRAFRNQGQVCTATTRVLVHHSIKDALVERIIENASSLVPQDPLLESARFGALISAGHRDKVQAYVARGRREGARIAYQGQTEPPVEGGFYLPPTIFEGVDPGHAIAREEIFGPVLSIMTFGDEEDAIRLANATDYGLSATVWTSDIGRAHRMAGAIQAGWVVINSTATPVGGNGHALSIGGQKQSGIGVEGGLDGLRQFCASTVVQVHSADGKA